MAKQKVSEREYLGAGESGLADRIEEATGARYSLVEKDGENFVALQTWDETFKDPKVALKFAILGYHTKLGNVANTIMNPGAGEPKGSLADAAAEIDKFLAGVKEGKWAERVGGTGGGIRYDVEVLADALAQATGRDRGEFISKMTWRVDPKTGQQVQADAEGEFPKGSRTYAAFAYANKKVAAIYDAKKGTGTSADLL